MPGIFEIKKAKDGQFHFHLKATNGRIILSSEMYRAKASALNGIQSVTKNSQSDGRFQRLTSKDGSPYFVLKAANSQIIGNSEMYDTESAREKGIDSVRKNAADAQLKDLTIA